MSKPRSTKSKTPSGGSGVFIFDCNSEAKKFMIDTAAQHKARSGVEWPVFLLKAIIAFGVMSYQDRHRLHTPEEKLSPETLATIAAMAYPFHIYLPDIKRGVMEIICSDLQ